MKLKDAPAPFYRNSDSARGIYADVLIPLALLYVNPFIYSGARTLTLLGVSLLTCLICETLFCLFSKRTITLGDVSAVITAMIIPLLLPVTVPYYIIIFAGAFAILAAKMPFGGFGRNLFNPAAAGLAFVTVSFPEEVFKFRDTKLLSEIPVFGKFAFESANSPAANLKAGVRPDILPTEMLLGNFSGPMGTTAALIIAACGLYLLVRRTIKWQTPVCFIASAAIMALLFPRISGRWSDSVVFELLSGSLVFCAVFMANDPVTSPKTGFARAIYGVIGGVGTMLFRYFGAYEEGTCFMILLMNALSFALDRFAFKASLYKEGLKWKTAS